MNVRNMLLVTAAGGIATATGIGFTLIPLRMVATYRFAVAIAYFAIVVACLAGFAVARSRKMGRLALTCETVFIASTFGVWGVLKLYGPPN